MSVPMAIIDEKLVKSLVHAMIHSGDPGAACHLDDYSGKFILKLEANIPEKYRKKFLRRIKTSESDLTTEQATGGG
jgi:hypothetical protein